MNIPIFLMHYSSGRSHRIFTLLVLLLGGILVGSAVAQVRGSLWNNPSFRRQMEYSLAVNTEIEPPMSDPESVIFAEIVDIIGSNPDEAARLIQETMANLPNPSAIWPFTLGTIYFQQDKRDEAEAQFLQAIERFPSFLRAYQNLGTLYVQASRHEEAIANLTKVIELGGSNGLLYGLLGVSYITLERYLPAEIAFRQAILLNPDVDDWKLGLARTLLAQQRFGEVVSLTDQMIRTKPEDATLWNLQTSAHIGAENITAAAANLEVLKRLGKADARMLSTLADIYTNEGLMQLAAENYIASFESEGGGDSKALIRSANILLDRQAADDAQRIVERARDAVASLDDPEQEVEILKLQSKMAQARGNAAESARFLQQVVEKDPLDGTALLELGKFYASTSDQDGREQIERALFYYERAQGLEKFEADANLRIAQIYVKQDKIADAIPLLKRAQDIKPRDSVARFLDELERYARTRR